ncbi:MAG: hypothetical protein WCB31_13625 [Nitrososphaeraceae archaeon]
MSDTKKFKKPEDFNPEQDWRKPGTGTKPVDLKSHIDGPENSEQLLDTELASKSQKKPKNGFKIFNHYSKNFTGLMYHQYTEFWKSLRDIFLKLQCRL